jgi:hypothetical protein
MDPNAFFAYWAEVDFKFPNRGIVYVYRTWPRIDRQKIDPEAYKYSDKMDKAFPSPDQWRQEMLHRYGSGNYKLILNDAGGHAKSVGQTMIADLRDSDYPPVIENLDELVMDDPTNQSFIESLRQKGILPGERELQNAESTQALTGTIDKLTNKVVEMGKTQAPPAAPPGSTEVAREAMLMARDVFQQGLNLGKETVQAQADATVAAAKAESQASNPTQAIDNVVQLIGLVKSLMPTPALATGGGQSQDFTAILNNMASQNSQLQQKIFEVLQSQINTLSQPRVVASPNPDGAAAGQTPKQDDFVSQLKKLGELKDTMQDIFGGGRDDEDAPREKPEPMWMKLGMAALAGLPTLAMSLVGMSYNMAVAKTGQGAPMAPNQLPSPAEVPGMGAVLVADNPNPNPNPTPAPGGQMNAIQRNVYLAMLQQIEKPLLAHLNNPDKTGVDFAQAMMDFHGNVAYQATKGLGKEVLMGLLMSYKPIADVLVTIPEQANQFVDDFLNAEEIIAQEEAEEAGSEGLETLQTPAAVPATEGKKTKGKR